MLEGPSPPAVRRSPDGTGVRAQLRAQNAVEFGRRACRSPRLPATCLFVCLRDAAGSRCRPASARPNSNRPVVPRSSLLGEGLALAQLSPPRRRRETLRRAGRDPEGRSKGPPVKAALLG